MSNSSRKYESYDTSDWLARVQGSASKELSLAGKRFDPELRKEIRRFLAEEKSAHPMLRPVDAKREVEDRFQIAMSTQTFKTTYWDKSDPEDQERSSEQGRPPMNEAPARPRTPLPEALREALPSLNGSGSKKSAVHYESEFGMFEMTPADPEQEYFDVKFIVRAPRSSAVFLQGQGFALLFPVLKEQKDK